jgi:hypothetical protein
MGDKPTGARPEDASARLAGILFQAFFFFQKRQANVL